MCVYQRKEIRKVLDDFCGLFQFADRAILRLAPFALLCSTRIPFPIPATGPPATQGGIIESEP